MATNHPAPVEPVTFALQWSENKPPCEECRYDHCEAQTPFGSFLITWKSWKEYDSPTVDETPWGDFWQAFATVELAKAACQREFDTRLALCGLTQSAPVEPGRVERLPDGKPYPTPPGPLSEHELREAWNRQSDPFNEWDSLDTGEQLAWAQARAIAADRARRATPVDLDALLSPAGPYETGPDAGNAPGAQLVRNQHGGNPTWWAPVFGSDSLDDLLSRIRGRILPHLRPPVIGIDVPGPDGDWGDVADLCEAEGVRVEAGARLLRRAREAWGQATPPAEGEVRKLAAFLEKLGSDYDDLYPPQQSITLFRAADLLQQQADELAMLRSQQLSSPAVVDVGQLPGWMFHPADWLDGVGHG